MAGRPTPGPPSRRSRAPWRLRSRTLCREIGAAQLPALRAVSGDLRSPTSDGGRRASGSRFPIAPRSSSAFGSAPLGPSRVRLASRPSASRRCAPSSRRTGRRRRSALKRPREADVGGSVRGGKRRGRPTRGLSRRPSRRCSQNRRRHRPTASRLIPRRAPISVLVLPRRPSARAWRAAPPDAAACSRRRRAQARSARPRSRPPRGGCDPASPHQFAATTLPQARRDLRQEGLCRRVSGSHAVHRTTRASHSHREAAPTSSGVCTPRWVKASPSLSVWRLSSTALLRPLAGHSQIGGDCKRRRPSKGDFATSTSGCGGDGRRVRTSASCVLILGVDAVPE
jgi:hypothetical protein